MNTKAKRVTGVVLYVVTDAYMQTKVMRPSELQSIVTVRRENIFRSLAISEIKRFRLARPNKTEPASFPCSREGTGRASLALHERVNHGNE